MGALLSRTSRVIPSEEWMADGAPCQEAFLPPYRHEFLGFLLSWQFGDSYSTPVGVSERSSSSTAKQMHNVSEK